MVRLFEATHEAMAGLAAQQAMRHSFPSMKTASSGKTAARSDQCRRCGPDKVERAGAAHVERRPAGGARTLLGHSVMSPRCGSAC
eukprot:3153412-Prymnesium_polylepis.1